MGLIFALAGFTAGWLVHRLADDLPRRAGKAIGADPAPAAPALWRLLRSRDGREPWFWLRLAVELFSAAVIALAATRMTLGEASIVIGAYLFFMLIAVIDVRFRLILNILTYPAMVLVLALNLALARQTLTAVLLGGGLVFGIFYLTAWLRPGQLGGGDVKLATLMGLLFGFPQVLWALLVGAGAGGIVAVAMLISRRFTLKSRIPYAPFLCLGAMIALLYNPFVM